MTLGSLFSGVGGLDLGFERAGFTVAWMCEKDPYCRRVLARHWPTVPCYEDVRNLPADLPTVDVVAGGFPCQPFSTAGKRGGTEDDRYLWPEMLAAIRLARPRYVVGENVAGLVSLDGGVVLDGVLADLEGAGYEVLPPVVFPACAVDAPHRRDRIWIIAHAHGERLEGAEPLGLGLGVESEHRNDRASVAHPDHGGRTPVEHAGGGAETARRREGHPLPSGPVWPVAHSEREGREGQPGRLDVRGHQPGRLPAQQNGSVATSGLRHGGNDVGLWSPEPNVGRVANGVPRRVDRLRALGNAVVPQVAEVVARALRAHAEASGLCGPFTKLVLHRTERR